MHQADVHHRALINDQRITAERILRVFREDQVHVVFRKLCAQHAMDGGCLHSRKLGHALRRTSGGRSQQGFEAQPVIELQHRPQ